MSTEKENEVPQAEIEKAEAAPLADETLEKVSGAGTAASRFIKENAKPLPVSPFGDDELIRR